MRHLAIECSSFGGSIALLRGSEVLCRQVLDGKSGSVMGFALLIKGMLSGQSGPPELVSVTSGPGSFTGLRVGLATAKCLAYAWRVPVVGVDTLQAIAMRTTMEFSRQQQGYKLVSVVNAFRKQVFAAGWHVNNRGLPTILKSPQVVDAARWIESPWQSQTGDSHVSESDEAFSDNSQITRVTGPGLREYLPTANQTIEIVSSDLWDPRADEVGQIGWEKYLRGEICTATTLAANYVRQSAAEEKKTNSLEF